MDYGDCSAVADKGSTGNSLFLLEHNLVESMLRFNVKSSFALVDGIYQELSFHELNDSHLNFDSNYEVILIDQTYGIADSYIIPVINNYTYPTIITNGTYSILSGYSGLNDIYVNVLILSGNTIIINRLIDIDVDSFSYILASSSGSFNYHASNDSDMTFEGYY